MNHLEVLPDSAAWVPSPDTVASFSGPARACRVHGPARLLRLTTAGGVAPEGWEFEANRADGAFWFAEADYLAIRRAAEKDLRHQSTAEQPAKAVLESRLRMYLRHVLRSSLAIRRDWTPAFDNYALLEVPRGRSVVAWVGRIAQQPVYSAEVVGNERAEELRRMKLQLEGGLNQYVIRFDFPDNRPAGQWIKPGQWL